MKLGPVHEDRIEALVGYKAFLVDQMKSEDDADAMIARLQACGRALIEAAPEDADPGRLTHSLDCLRDFLDGFQASLDIATAKHKRLRRAEPAPELPH